MNQHKLTQPDLETNTTRATIQILLLVVVTLFLAVPALAQAPDSALPETTSGSSGGPASQPMASRSKFAVFIDAGVAVPHGDFNVFFDPGFSLNAGLEYMVTSQFSAVGTFGYHRFSSFFDDHVNLYQVSGNGKFYLVDDTKKVRPFVNGGVGAYVTDSATVHFGGNVGAGVLYEVTPSFGLQGSYNFHIFNTFSNLKYSSVQGGVRFRF
ncbi:MAG TPA: outer membrane beta-barrel protein [Pyrinomonadaceae bacterium]|nr:outer membrane beta-barrel protein [Pyrinomonadaceae bacterium]